MFDRKSLLLAALDLLFWLVESITCSLIQHAVTYRGCFPGFRPVEHRIQSKLSHTHSSYSLFTQSSTVSDVGELVEQTQEKTTIHCLTFAVLCKVVLTEDYMEVFIFVKRFRFL